MKKIKRYGIHFVLLFLVLVQIAVLLHVFPNEAMALAPAQCGTLYCYCECTGILCTYATSGPNCVCTCTIGSGDLCVWFPHP
jgi:hypothetical protein